jgi:predicted ATP-dependent protease
MGKSGVTVIDREVKMSGSLHDKGVLILSGFLHGKFGQKRQLSMSASITFEQSYVQVDGDSASSTELYGILSSLSGYPIKQGIAVTGSVNQMGEIQPIGGVSKKIEGFFDVCKTKGLTNEQGVIIPKTNLQHLMLKEEILEAVRQNKFHIYPVTSIDEGIEILTGVPAGKQNKNGGYPEHTVYWAVEKRLKEMDEQPKDSEKSDVDKKKEKNSNEKNKEKKESSARG